MNWTAIAIIISTGICLGIFLSNAKYRDFDTLVKYAEEKIKTK